MLNFIFFGRLEKEKGIDLILDFIRSYPDFCKEKSFNFFIFGDGTYRQVVEELDKKFSFVQYFGWQPKDVIKNYLKKSDFTLMPSRFLETFGLSALESIAEGVPVIGFKKGGLKQFIFDEFNIYKEISEDYDQKISEDFLLLEAVGTKSSGISLLFNNWFLKNDLWDKRDDQLKRYYRQKCLILAQEYKVEKWLEKFYRIIKEE